MANQNNRNKQGSVYMPNDNSSTPTHMLPIKKVPANIVSFFCGFQLFLLFIWLFIPDSIDSKWEDLYTFYLFCIVMCPILTLVYIFTIRQKT